MARAVPHDDRNRAARVGAGVRAGLGVCPAAYPTDTPSAYAGKGEFMAAASAVKIGHTGESLVVTYLKAKGYRITSWDTQGPGATDIEASGTQATLLVQVKTAVWPNNPVGLNSQERQALASRASRKRAQAWEAKVTLDSSLRLVGEIAWRKLN